MSACGNPADHYLLALAICVTKMDVCGTTQRETRAFEYPNVCAKVEASIRWGLPPNTNWCANSAERGSANSVASFEGVASPARRLTIEEQKLGEWQIAEARVWLWRLWLQCQKKKQYPHTGWGEYGKELTRRVMLNITSWQRPNQRSTPCEEQFGELFGNL